MTTPLKAATPGNLSNGDAQDKLLDALKLKLTNTQIGTITSALASNQKNDAIKQTVSGMLGGGSSAPVAPVANAGSAQNVVVGSAVTLDATASSVATGKQLAYAWTLTAKPVNSNASLSSPSTAKPTFVADVAGSYVASLVVNDGTSSSSAAAVTITASVSNAAPVANAGVAQNVVAGSTVTLDGSVSSDANGDALTYAWTLTSKPSGSAATLSSATSARPTFTADLAGSYVGTLMVNDGKVNSTSVTVSITAAVANVAPVANAGIAQNVVAGSLVTLDGSASSDANSDALTYAWTLTSKPSGSAATLSSATSAKPTFTTDLAGTYVGTLTVNDGKVNSTSVTVSITATSANKLTLSLTPGSSCFFSCVDTPLTLPYSTSTASSANSVCVGNGCPTAYTIDSFKLQAIGQSYTITSLQASNSTTGSAVVPLFSGLVNGQVIAAGETLKFSLQSTFTLGSTVSLNYSFTVQETGQTFIYTVQIRTN